MPSSWPRSATLHSGKNIYHENRVYLTGQIDRRFRGSLKQLEGYEDEKHWPYVKDTISAFKAKIMHKCSSMIEQEELDPLRTSVFVSHKQTNKEESWRSLVEFKPQWKRSSYNTDFVISVEWRWGKTYGKKELPMPSEPRQTTEKQESRPDERSSMTMTLPWWYCVNHNVQVLSNTFQGSFSKDKYSLLSRPWLDTTWKLVGTLLIEDQLWRLSSAGSFWTDLMDERECRFGCQSFALKGQGGPTWSMGIWSLGWRGGTGVPKATEPSWVAWNSAHPLGMQPYVCRSPFESQRSDLTFVVVDI